MATVQMPDGTMVDMPDDIDPAMGARLRKFADAQKAPASTLGQDLTRMGAGAIPLAASLANPWANPVQTAKTLGTLGAGAASATTQGVGDVLNLFRGHLAASDPNRYNFGFSVPGQPAQQLANLSEGQAGLLGKGSRAAMGAVGVPQQNQNTIMDYAPGAISAATTLAPFLKGVPPLVRGAGNLGARALVGAGNVAERLMPDRAQTPILGKSQGLGSPQSMGAAAVDAGALPAGAPEVDARPVPGGLPPEYQNQRAAILRQAGFTQARQSAIEGNANRAAVDYHISKEKSEPAAEAASKVFAGERDTLIKHGENVIADTGGTIYPDMAESDLKAAGKIMATPFDKARTWIGDEKQKLYDEADAAAEASGARTPLATLKTALNAPDFKELLLGLNDENLGTSIESRLDRLLKENGGSVTPKTAQSLRKFMNQLWTPDRSGIIGNLKQSFDQDIFQAAGQNFYARADALHQLEHQLLDDPNGISKLFDVDPKTAVNRATPYAEIPDKLFNLDNDQIGHILDVLRDRMPTSILPDAEAALGAIRGHFANRLLQAGMETKGGKFSRLWSPDRVEKLWRDNDASFQDVFQDDPEGLRGLEIMRSAGKILDFDPAYQGAFQEAHNLFKRGIIAKAIPAATAGIGGTIGMAIEPTGIAAGLGAGIGSTAGEWAAGQGSSARALKLWNAGMRDLGPEPARQSRSPIPPTSRNPIGGPQATPGPRGGSAGESTPPGTPPPRGSAPPSSASPGGSVPPTPPHVGGTPGAGPSLGTAASAARSQREYMDRLMKLAQGHEEVAQAVGPKPEVRPRAASIDTLMKGHVVAGPEFGDWLPGEPTQSQAPPQSMPFTMPPQTAAPPAFRATPYVDPRAFVQSRLGVLANPTEGAATPFLRGVQAKRPEGTASATTFEQALQNAPALPQSFAHGAEVTRLLAQESGRANLTKFVTGLEHDVTQGTVTPERGLWEIFKKWGISLPEPADQKVGATLAEVHAERAAEGKAATRVDMSRLASLVNPKAAIDKVLATGKEIDRTAAQGSDTGVKTAGPMGSTALPTAHLSSPLAATLRAALERYPLEAVPTTRAGLMGSVTPPAAARSEGLMGQSSGPSPELQALRSRKQQGAAPTADADRARIAKALGVPEEAVTPNVLMLHKALEEAERDKWAATAGGVNMIVGLRSGLAGEVRNSMRKLDKPGWNLPSLYSTL